MSPSTKWMLAAAVVGWPLLVGVNAIFHPAIEFTAAGVLAGAAQAPGTWYAVHLFAALGSLLAIPAAFGLRTLVRERGRRLANAGAAAAMVAGVTLAVAFGIEASVLRLAVTAGLDDAAALALAEGHLGAPETFAVPVGVLAITLAGVLLAAALLAARAVPQWQAITYALAMLATLGAVPGSPFGPIAFGVVTFAAVFLASHIVRGDTREPAAVGRAPRPEPALGR